MAAGRSRIAAGLVLATLAGGCTASSPGGESEMIVRATLQALVSDGRSICVDSRTRGQPLAVFRTMLQAPVPSRRPLAWRVPSPLQPPKGLSDRQIYDDQIRGVRVYLDRQPPGGARFPLEIQSRLDTLAANLSVTGASDPVNVAGSWSSPRVTSRWWLLNRFSADCSPNYVLSNPVSRGNIAFITVTADHWGKTFALQRKANQWSLVAEWTGWLY